MFIRNFSKLRPKNDKTMKVHGLPNCDSCRRARRWLEAVGADYRFRNLRKDPPASAEVRRWAGAVGWERLLNRRSTTWRGIPEPARTDLDAARAVALMVAYPALVKRPVVESDAGIAVGVDEAAWAGLVGS